MTDPVLLTAPDSMIAASTVMGLSYIVGSGKSPFTGEEDFFKWPGEQWLVDFRLPPEVDRDVFEEWVAFALKLKGRWGRFLLCPPLGKNPLGIGGGSPLVDGALQTGNELDIKNCPLNTTDYLLTGSYFQLGTGASSRLHKLVADADTDGTGRTTLEFEPAIITAPADSAAVTINSPKGLFRMVENTVSWGIDPGPVFRFSFNAVSVVG